jgi:chitodextrinase
VTGAAENDYLSQSVPVGVLTNGTNTVAVEVHNRSGSSDVSFDLELEPTLAPGDQVAPSQPQNLREAGVTASTVDLAWDASTDNVGVTGYRITRNAAVAATVDGLSWTDTGRTPGATYTYTVTALDAAGNASAASEPLAVTMPPDTTQPSAPGSVSADPAPSGTRVDLSWTAATDDVAVAGYQVLRDGVQLGGDTTARTYADTTAQPGTTYTYAVLAVDAAGNAGPTSEVTVTTPTAPPPDPVLHAETWSADNGSPWPSAWNTSTKSGVVDVQGGAGRLRLTNTSGAFARATLTGVSPVRNTDLLFSYQWSSATARSSFNVYVRGSGGWQNGNRPMTGYGLNFVSDSSRVTVQKNVGGVLTNIDAVPTAQPVGTGKRWVRLRVVGDQLMFRTWAGPDEPSGWTWSGTDASIAGPGAVYLTHVQQGTSAQERNVLVDDLTLREGTG